MIIKRTPDYDRNRKEFIVIEYCCSEIGREMKECSDWFITDDMMWCSDGEDTIGGRFCCYCGQKIIIQ